jgi:hypothetical protein
MALAEPDNDGANDESQSTVLAEPKATKAKRSRPALRLYVEGGAA